MRIRVSFKGPIGSRMAPITVEVGAERLSISQVLELVARRLPALFTGKGVPRPGVLVFINGRDYRVYEEGDEVEGEASVDIIQVFHGG